MFSRRRIFILLRGYDVLELAIIEKPRERGQKNKNYASTRQNSTPKDVTPTRALNMYRLIMHTFGCFRYSFGNRRVSVDDSSEFIGCGFECHADTGFCEQFSRVRADDVNAENF